LGHHPDIYTVDIEVAYFNNRTRYNQFGSDWYRAQFSGWNGERFVGEATPSYMMHRHHPGQIAKRIQATIPDVRLMAVLRNPIDRAQSAMLHHIKHGRIPPGARLVDVARRQRPKDEWMGLISGGWYANSLKPYFDRFGDQLLVFLHDDVATDPHGLYKQALEHIGADSTFVPPALQEVVFSNSGRKHQPHPLSQEDRVELYEYFARDIRALERMIGRDLSAWTPAPAQQATPTTPPPSTRLKNQLVGRFDVAVEWLEQRLQQVPLDDPASEASARARDMIKRLSFYRSVLTRGLIDDNAAPEAAEHAPIVDMYRTATQLFRNEIVRPGVIDQIVATPLGPIDASSFVRLVMVDQVARGAALTEPKPGELRLPVRIGRLVESIAERLEATYGAQMWEADDEYGALLRYLRESRKYAVEAFNAG
jgi:hypothetical protein